MLIVPMVRIRIVLPWPSLHPPLLPFPPVPDAAKVLLSLIGKMTMTASYHLTWVYTAELFSTASRARVLGEASVFSRVVTVAVPYINDLLVSSPQEEASIIGDEATTMLCS